MFPGTKILVLIAACAIITSGASPLGRASADLVKRSPASNKSLDTSFRRLGNEELQYNGPLYVADFSDDEEITYHDNNEEGNGHQQIDPLVQQQEQEEHAIAQDLLRQDLVALENVQGFLPGRRDSKLIAANGFDLLEIDIMVEDIATNQECQFPLLHDEDFIQHQHDFMTSILFARRILIEQSLMGDKAGAVNWIETDNTQVAYRLVVEAVNSFKAMRRRYFEMRAEWRSSQQA